jgi:hypothetical protein
MNDRARGALGRLDRRTVAEAHRDRLQRGQFVIRPEPLRLHETWRSTRIGPSPLP